MLSRKLQSAKLLRWALALIALIQPLTTPLCACECQEVVSAEEPGSCEHEHSDHQEDSCSSLDCHEDGVADAQYEQGLSNCYQEVCGFGPCHCPPACQCQLRHAQQVIHSEASTRSPTSDVAILAPTGNGLVDKPRTQTRMCSFLDQRLFLSGASCCALLCRFVI